MHRFDLRQRPLWYAWVVVFLLARPCDCFPLQGKLQFGSQAAYDHFGSAIAFSDDGGFMFIGAKDASGKGAVYWFTNSNSWNYGGTLDPLVFDLTTGDLFGSSIAVNSDASYVIVGAPGVKGVTATLNQGKAFIFNRTGSNWGLHLRLENPFGDAQDKFGTSVAMDAQGDIAIVGIPGKNTNEGGAEVFFRDADNSGWSSKNTLTAFTPASGDYFGTSVSITGAGDVIAIGAPGTTSNTHAGAGTVSLYSCDAGNISPVSLLDVLALSNAADGDAFGSVVTLSQDGNYMVVTAKQRMVGSNTFQGAAYAFTRAALTYEPAGTIYASSGGAANDYFGSSAALSGDGSAYIVGAYMKTIGSNSSQGYAYFFRRNAASAWVQDPPLSLPGSANNLIGYAVALSNDGNYGAVGAVDAPGFYGAVEAGLVFTLTIPPAPSISPSPSLSPSVSLTRSGSASGAPTPTMSASPMSVSVSTTPSMSYTPSRTNSESAAMSLSRSITITASTTASVSVSVSASVSVTGSLTGSTTGSITASASITLLPSNSNTRTWTQTGSYSMSTSMSMSVSPSVTCSGTAGSTPTGTASAMLSATGSVTGSTTASATSSITSSASVASTASGSTIPSESQIPTITQSPAVTPTYSVSPTASPSPSTSASGTSSGIPPSPIPATMTATATQSASPSRSPSPTPSQYSESLVLSPRLDASVQIQQDAVILSDSTPVLNVELTVAYCVTPCVVTCSVEQPALASVYPTRLQVPTWTTSSPRASYALQLWVPFGSCFNASTTALTCSTRRGVNARMPIMCKPTRWPMFHDAILLLPERTFATSAWYGARNITYAGGDVAAIARAFNGSNNLAGSAAAPFVLSVTGNSDLILVAHATSNRLPPFTPTSRVYINNKEAYVSWVSADGLLLRFRLPPKDSYCSLSAMTSSTGDCGYVQLTIASATDAVGLGATLSCPPFCPHDVPGSVPVAILSSDGVVRMVPGTSADATMSMPPTPILLDYLPSTGLYVTENCASLGFTNPALGVCTNTSNPLHTMCAFGSGDACKLCPDGALCPGGFRAWPVAGYFTFAEASGEVIPCGSPARERCIGWSSSLSAVECGSGYRTGSYACSACADGYFQQLDTTCAVCPHDTRAPITSILQDVFTLIGGLVGACAAVYIFVWVLARWRKTSVNGLVKRTLQLGVWAFTTIQVVSQVGKAASPGLPSFVLLLYSSLAIFQFEGVTLPSACMPGFPFGNEVASMTAALLLLAIGSLAWCVTGRREIHEVQTMGPARDGVNSGKAGVGTLADTRSVTIPALVLRICVMGMTVLYPNATNAVISMLYCSPGSIVTSVRASSSPLSSPLPSSTGIGYAATSQQVQQVELLQFNPSYVCYEGNHLPAAALAWVVLLLYCLGYPAVTFGWNHARIRWWQAKVQGGKRLSVANSLHDSSNRVLSASSRKSLVVVGAPLSPPLSSPLLATIPSPFSARRPPMTNKYPPPCHSKSFSKPDVAPIPGIASDGRLAPFVRSDYIPRHHYFYGLDRGVIFVLAIVSALCRDTSAALPKFLVTWIILVSMGLLLLVKRPYQSDARWKLPVKIASFVLCCIAALLNYVTAIGAPVAVITSLAYMAIIGSITLFIILLVSFLAVLLRQLSPPPVPPATEEGESQLKGKEWASDNPLLARVASAAQARRRVSARLSSTNMLGNEDKEVSALQSRRAALRPSGFASPDSPGALLRFARPSAVQPVHIRSIRTVSSSASAGSGRQGSSPRRNSRQSMARVPMQSPHSR